MAKLTNSILLKQQQRLSAMQIQLMQLIQLPALALEQRIKEELEVNPILEEAEEQTPDASLEQMEDEVEETQNDIDQYLQDDDVAEYKLHKEDRNESNLFVSYQNFQEDLLFQLDMQDLSEDEKVIGREIIGNLDYAGYLTRSVEAICDDVLFRYNIEITNKQVTKVLSVIQSFEPAGIAARDLRECLLLQINRFKDENEDTAIAKQILEHHFIAFTNRHYQSIIQKLNCSEEQLQSAISVIVSLNPKPANTQPELTDKMTIIPDYTLWLQNGQIVFILNKFNSQSLRLNNFYQNMLTDLNHSKTQANKETIQFIKTKTESAKIFIDALDKRVETLTRTMQAIIDFQHNYFIDGDITQLKPMKLLDIAHKIDMDISTVSRVVSNKYVQTHFGIFKLKDFFSNFMINDKGEAITTGRIRAILSESINNEDKLKPLTDEQLETILNAKGYPIARRTIAKYREGLGISVARMRKELL
ncbi:MAG: RNA polymerase factor sigma-54 [Bacteroidales bacterium]|jgi:RNA polymerase sigma-54 factor|nr:RNA polymerase factor sigma-54 [Bacteroidales bacterium]